MKTGKEWLLEQLNGFENHKDYKEDNIKAIADFMEHYAKYYHEQQVKSVDLADVGGSLPDDKKCCGRCIEGLDACIHDGE